VIGYRRHTLSWMVSVVRSMEALHDHAFIQALPGWRLTPCLIEHGHLSILTARP
jgi:hypothetical protein